MAKVPVWAMGYALRLAGVPCAEEIAMMLVRGKETVPEQPDVPVIPDVPDTVDTLEVLGGSYVDTVYFNGNGKNEASTEFLVGKFPLEQTFEWVYHWGWDTAYGTNTASLALQLVNLSWADRVGDFIKLRYMLPEITRCKFYDTNSAQASVYKNPDYYSFQMSLNGSGAVCTVSHRSDSGMVQCTDAAPLLTDRTFTPIMDGNDLLGFELSGYLQHPVTSIDIVISGHKSSAYNNADLYVKYSGYDDLIVEVYDVGV